MIIKTPSFEINLAQLKEQAKAVEEIAPGPWQREPLSIGTIEDFAGEGIGHIHERKRDPSLPLGDQLVQSNKNRNITADFIAACSPDVILALIERIESGE